ncbi:RNA methyltransferase [Prochlorothrix hollandica]|uniref:RNA methyltransferase n=1 Tax=Prochlorothrix hollandica PCC 9006 = CALU 1027 TaxID=317619 RepID=A0A0M2Q0L3_PROHO|nr:RNA methyltransferase [Prochlorothrix hollandica]KKJ00182.1 RNA methyltransferase [Prochlorothrix hollandica PCC 9006 = CALU 1027]
MDWIRIVLVEPAGPLNVGSVARVMKNFGLGQLVLVNPQCDPLGPEALQMAVHGRDLLTQAQRVESLPAALEGCHRAIATSGRDRLIPLPLGTPRQMLPWLLEPGPGSGSGPGSRSNAPPQSAALIFGREDSGLTNGELHYAQRLVQVPSCDTYTSLNLAQAVAVCCYELRCLALDTPSGGQSPQDPLPPVVPPLQSDRPQSDRPLDTAPGITDHGGNQTASLTDLERYYGKLEQVLLTIGYLYPHTATRRMEKFRRLYGRMQLSPQELAMLQGILRQTEWALGSKLGATNSPGPLP